MAARTCEGRSRATTARIRLSFEHSTAGFHRAAAAHAAAQRITVNTDLDRPAAPFRLMHGPRESDRPFRAFRPRSPSRKEKSPSTRAVIAEQHWQVQPLTEEVANNV